MISEVGVPSYWYLITRFGEAQNLLPAALWVCLALVRAEATRPLGYRWLLGLALVALLDTASKVAFIGWGMGVARWNFTGFSGHAMFSAAVYPLLMTTLTARLAPVWQRVALGCGFALAALVGVSRVMVDAHSVSEVVLGLLLGSAVTLLAILQAGLPQVVWRLYVPVLLGVWMVVAPLVAPPLPTHWMVTRLALLLSGHVRPYTRLDMLRGARRKTPPVHQPQPIAPG
ncbi:phosphatase PAP2 family protein [Rhodoferax sp.]|uniref:phosphatase PAP2 family protein n=1 Tax=Rhodoferax sp. TaxID=50421 RepID=UPI002845F5C6|nr:phosphatase PAP2 family protein [Rhodoferax sp.]MDR3368376.1 phosphatase PAP2 family protein [Rhodoferax sp.]